MILLGEEQKIEFILESLKHTQNMISFADTKSNITLAIQSFLISIVLGTSFLLDSLENIQEISNCNISYFFYAIVICFIISSLIGIILSLFVYKARSSIYGIKNGLFYFEHIALYPKFDDYFDEINSLNDKIIFKELTQSVYYLSNIAKKKMKYVNLSIIFVTIQPPYK